MHQGRGLWFPALRAASAHARVVEAGVRVEGGWSPGRTATVRPGLLLVRIRVHTWTDGVTLRPRYCRQANTGAERAL